MGGNRRSVSRSCFNLIIVFLFTGIWHGASWNFVVWGLYYVAFLILEKLLIGKTLGRSLKTIQHLYTIIIVVIGWRFFRADNLSNAVIYIQNMFTVTEDSLKQLITVIDKQYIFCIIVGVLLSVPIMKNIFEIFRQKKIEYISDIIIVIVFVIAISYLLGSGFSPFLYFRF